MADVQTEGTGILAYRDSIRGCFGDHGISPIEYFFVIAISVLLDHNGLYREFLAKDSLLYGDLCDDGGRNYARDDSELLFSL